MTTSGEAPGRLDLLGGVADYSGALVLQVPTRCRTTVTVEPSDVFEVGPARLTTGELGALAVMSYSDLRHALGGLPRWTHYPIGVAVVLVRHGVIEPPSGRVTIQSDVPQAAGVSSSAALEVATARALGADIEPLHLALMCQEAENHVVGAPCGVMDQVAVTLGEPGAALPILCRPASVDAPVPLPPDVEVVGWPTGATHDVSGAEYGTARAAAFMGRRIIEDELGRRFDWVSDLPEDRVAALPDEIVGAAFLDRWGETGDHVTSVNPDVGYPVRAATTFGVEEHERTSQALAQLRAGRADALGPLMLASHHGYQAMGLGHPAADGVVADATGRAGVIGARSSGGGCGGTVVVLCRRGALDDIDGLIRWG